MRIAALFVLIALAGCLEGQQPESDDDKDTTPTVPEGPPRVSIKDSTGNASSEETFGGSIPTFELLKFTDRISGEPTVGITRTGAVFYAAIDFDGLAGNPMTIYYRSSDNGTTWVDKSPQIAGVATHPTSADPYTYADPTTGRIYALDMGPSVACNKVSWSDDDGETWITREGACPLPVADHPTLFAGPRVGPSTGGTPVYPNSLYLCTNQLVDVQCSLSLDGGATWLPSVPVYADCGGLIGHSHASWADGTVYVGRVGCGIPEVSVSRDGGATYTEVNIATEDQYLGTDHELVVYTDKGGTAYAFWIGSQGTKAWLSISRDQGASWEKPIDVTADGVTAAKLPSLVAGEEGRIAFLYIGTTTPSGWQVGATGNEAELLNATWNAYVGISLNADQDNPTFVTVLAHNETEPMKRGNCQGRCFGTAGGMYDFLDIDIDPITGQLWLALVDVCTGECDLPDANADTPQYAKGAVAKQTGGTTLLASPIAARS